MLVNPGAAIEEELAQLLGIKGIVALPVEPQSDPTTGIESRLEIVEEKRPLPWPPERLTLVSVETNHERGDEIELPVESRERLERLHARDHALQPERTKHFAEHRDVIDIKPEGAMAQPMTDVKEVTCTGPEIENALTSAPIEFELLHPSEIDSDPPIQIEIFSPASARILDGVAIVNRLELDRVYAPDDLLDIEAKNKAPGQNHAPEVPFHAGQETRICEFSKLVGETHRSERLYP